MDETDAFVGKIGIRSLPKGAKVGTSSPIRKKAIEEINPHIETVSVRGNIKERMAMVEDGRLAGVIVATCALKRLGLGKYIKEILPYETAPLQGQLAVVGREGDFGLKKVFSAIDERKKYGKVILVGAGPGDPELITLKAVNALKKAQVVFYDFLTGPRFLQYAKKAKAVYVGKRKGEHALSQGELSLMLRCEAMNGKSVVRLKGGDPLIFGRGADEIEYLRSYHIEVEVIPGVSSATGIPSSLGIPLTARGISSSVAFLSGHGENESRSAPEPVAVPKADTIVFLMGLTKIGMIVQSLLDAGWKKTVPMVIISRGTMADEKIIYGTLDNIEGLAAKEKLEQPALIIAGEVVRFLEKGLAKKTVLYVGTNPGKYKAAFEEMVHLPMIQISGANFPPMTRKKIIAELGSSDLIIFTSRFAVRCFKDFLKKEKYPLFQLAKTDIAVIGKNTADELTKGKIKPSLIAGTETAEGLLKSLIQKYGAGLKGKKIFFPRSNLPNPYLRDELTKRGATVNEIAIYENKKPHQTHPPLHRIGKIFFTSPSTVKNFLSDYGMIPQGWQILCKGPVTKEALKKAGYASEVLVYDEIP